MKFFFRFGVCAALMVCGKAHAAQHVHDLTAMKRTSSPMMVSDREAHVSDILVAVNRRLERCEIVSEGITEIRSDREFSVDITALYNGRRDGTIWRYRASLGRHYADEVAYMLQWIPSAFFQQCRVRPNPQTGDARTQSYVTELVGLLNDRLDGCKLRDVGLVGDPNNRGLFRFFLVADYESGEEADRVQFEADINRRAAEEVENFLALIPSQAFDQCRHAEPDPDPDPDPNPDPDPDPDPNPDPDPDPDPNPNPDADVEQARERVKALVLQLNQSLNGCTVFISQGVTATRSGIGEFKMGAVYRDGEMAEPVALQTNVHRALLAELLHLESVLSEQYFTECSVIDSDNTDRNVNLLSEHLVEVTTALSGMFKNCLFGLSGQTVINDRQGNYTYGLTALNTRSGQFEESVHFRSNFHHTVDAELELLTQLIPAVEFQSCELGE